MNIKQRKIMTFFLKQYKEVLDKNKVQELHNFFSDFFSRAELIEILEYLYLNKIEEFDVNNKENEELLQLIGYDISILEFVIYKLESSITATPTLSQKEIEVFFEKIGSELHYLYSKPIEQWDEYDTSNYYSLLFKHGKTRRVFAIFTSDVEDKDKYAVTTKPSYFFDTQQEAEAELKHLIKEKNFKKEDLKIMSLWKIN